MKPLKSILVRLLLIAFILLGTALSGRKAESVVFSKSIINQNKLIEDKLPCYPDSVASPIARKIDSVIQNSINFRKFHGSILVAKDNKILFEKTYGWADMRAKIEIDETSAFQLASVSKPLTATAILMLVDQNRLTLDDPVVKYIPQFPYRQITIRQLLNHTSGLPMYFWLAEHKWADKKAPGNQEMIDLMAEHNLPLFFTPGKKFEYSNTGYFILASIIEKVSGLTFGEFMKNNIFEPLGMNNTYVYSFGYDSLKPNHLYGYRKYSSRGYAKIPETVNDGVVGDKNVYSTIEDLYKWIYALNNGLLISKENLELMYSKGQTKRGCEVPYGFGFRIGLEQNEPIIYHDGKWNGFRNSIKQYPNDSLVIIALEHSSNPFVKGLVNKVKYTTLQEL